MGRTVEMSFFPRNGKPILVYAILLFIALEIIVFCFAYPLMFQPASPTLARDFSAYYTAAWRLIHNPDKVYSWAAESGDYPISPFAAGFKYVPSFLFLILPFMSLDYQSAMVAFNVVQLALIPLLAFFVYELVKSKNIIFVIAVSAIVLVQPLPSIIGGGEFSFSVVLLYSYYMAWCHANAHILQTVLLVGAIYFSAYRKPFYSTLLFSFGLLDPRVALLAVPLLLWYSLKNRYLRRFMLYSLILVFVENTPFFFYHNILQALIDANLNLDVINQIYAYEWIPIYSIAALSISEIIAIIRNRHAKQNEGNGDMQVSLGTNI